MDVLHAAEHILQQHQSSRGWVGDLCYRIFLHPHRIEFRGDGTPHACVHLRINFDFQSDEGVRKFRKFVEEAADLVVRYGGSFSGEHGDGQSRAELLPKMFGPELIQAFREFKALWDPDWKMNPGKVVEPYKIDENLRVHPQLPNWQPQTHFQFPEDHEQRAGVG